MILLCRLLSFLPLGLLHAVGVFCGAVAWLFSPRIRRFQNENMRLALGARQSRKLAFQTICEAGKTALELPKLWLYPQAKVAPYVLEVRGKNLIEQAKSAGKGILFLTPHIGSFDMAGQFVASNFKITALYRPAKQAWLDALIKQGRARGNLQIAEANLSGVRKLLKALKNGETVGLLPDQTPRLGEGRWLNFFGKPAYTMTLAARLAETNCAVIYAVCERLPKGAGYILHFSAGKKTLEGTLNARAQLINHEIEALILQYPTQYLWAYNRYKRPSGVEKAPVQIDESTL